MKYTPPYGFIIDHKPDLIKAETSRGEGHCRFWKGLTNCSSLMFGGIDVMLLQSSIFRAKKLGGDGLEVSNWSCTIEVCRQSVRVKVLPIGI